MQLYDSRLKPIKWCTDIIHIPQLFKIKIFPKYVQSF